MSNSSVSSSEKQFLMYKILFKIVNVDGVGSITLALIYDMSVNLSGFHICVSKHALNGIYIGIMFKLQSCESVTRAVECDMFRDA